MIWTIVGSAAATLTMFSFVPQIVKAFKTKSIRDISEVTLFQLCAGAFLWALYGIHLRDLVIITANIVTLISLGVLLALYFKYGLPARAGREES